MRIGQQVTVVKRDERGHTIIEYAGTIISLTETGVCLKAHFGRGDVDIGLMVFRRGDTLLEWYYTDRYYNIFQVEDVDDGRLKGWYCNITRPAQFSSARITADDLALDLYVSPSGQITLLDREEFDALEISSLEREQAWQAVDAIRDLVQQRESPFDKIRT